MTGHATLASGTAPGTAPEADPLLSVLLAALQQAAQAAGEARLFRSGKLPGLFPQRSALMVQAADRALQQGLLEVVRQETRGKTTTTWVRLTPQGLRFLREQQSPLLVLQQLQEQLHAALPGLPRFLEELRQTLDALQRHLAAQVHHTLERLQNLAQQVEELLRGLAQPALPAALLQAVPWADAARDYLTARQALGQQTPCPLPELFLALHSSAPALTLADFHAGLRCLHDHGLLTLVPCPPDTPLPEPEYALLDGAATYYHAVWRGALPRAA
jgi:DNA-binding PadR family transcriptional regulator